MFVKQEVEKVFDHFLELDSPFGSSLNKFDDYSSSSPASPTSSMSSSPSTPTKQLSSSNFSRVPVIEEGTAPKKPKTNRKRKPDQMSSSGKKDHTCMAYLDVKKAKRRNQNRIAAQNSREKKKKYLQDLQRKLKLYMEQNGVLLDRVKHLEDENKSLRSGNTNTTTVPLQQPHIHTNTITGTMFSQPQPDTLQREPAPTDLPSLEPPKVKAERGVNNSIMTNVIEPLATSDESAELLTPQQSDVAKNNMFTIMVLFILPFLYLQVVSQVVNLWVMANQSTPSTVPVNNTSPTSTQPRSDQRKSNQSSSSSHPKLNNLREGIQAQLNSLTIPVRKICSSEHLKRPPPICHSQATFFQQDIFQHCLKS